jgi:hypothetical protein
METHTIRSLLSVVGARGQVLLTEDVANIKTVKYPLKGLFSKLVFDDTRLIGNISP